MVVGIVSFQQRAKPQGAGSIDLVSAAEIPAQNMLLVAVTLTLRNDANNSLWIHTLEAQVTSTDGHTYEDEAASVVDLGTATSRLFQF